VKKAQLILYVFAAFWLLSCTEVKSVREGASVVLIDSLEGSCPNFTKDQKGNTVLSWVRKTNDSTNVLCYATSTDDGLTFSEPVVITPSQTVKPHSENLPKLIFKPSGEIMAIWGTESSSTKNKYAGSISYAQSFDDGKSWTNAKPLVTDTAGYDQRYFDAALLPNGEVALIWLDNRKTTTQEGSALFFATTQGKQGFTAEKRLMQPTCQCCRTKIYVDSKSNIHAVFRGIYQDSIRDMMHLVSKDGGQTFSDAQRINHDNWVIKACPHTGPTMTENSEGLQFAWYTGGKKVGILNVSSKNVGKSFHQPQIISVKGKHPQMTTAPNGTTATVWDENASKGEQSVTKVGLQMRDSNDEILLKGFVSPDSINATYPVIIFSNNNQPVIAYTQKKNGKNFVAYQRMKF